MKLVRQPKDSSVCGQSCVATLLGISLHEAIGLVGKKGKTNVKHLVGPLSNKFDIKTNKLSRLKAAELLPEFAIIRVRWNKKESHWIIKKYETIYDPAAGVAELCHYLDCIHSVGGRITSYLPLQ